MATTGMYVTVEYVSLMERNFRRGPLYKSSKRTIHEWLAGNEAEMNNLFLWSRDFYQIVINCIIHFRHLTFKELSKDGTYGVILVLPLHVVLDELDVADGLLQLERVTFATPECAAFTVERTEVGRNGRRRRGRRRRGRRRWQIVEVDDLAEQLRTVIDAPGPAAAVVGVETPAGDVLCFIGKIRPE